ncbi:MAG: MGMT family protein [Candidatus Limnocylindria bacterium]
MVEGNDAHQEARRTPRAGSPRAYRAAGHALDSNPIPIVVPCHRVLHAGGGLGGYSGELDRKPYLLNLEEAS